MLQRPGRHQRGGIYAHWRRGFSPPRRTGRLVRLIPAESRWSPADEKRNSSGRSGHRSDRVSALWCPGASPSRRLRPSASGTIRHLQLLRGGEAVSNQALKCVEPHSASFAGISESSRSEEHTSELQSLMRISYAVFCLKKKKINKES